MRLGALFLFEICKKVALWCSFGIVLGISYSEVIEDLGTGPTTAYYSKGKENTSRTNKNEPTSKKRQLKKTIYFDHIYLTPPIGLYKVALSLIKQNPPPPCGSHHKTSLAEPHGGFGRHNLTFVEMLGADDDERYLAKWNNNITLSETKNLVKHHRNPVSTSQT